MEAKIMRNTCLFSILLSIFAIYSCDTTTNTKQETVAQTADTIIQTEKPTGQVYFLAPKLDKETGLVYGDCNCCWENLILLDNVRFVSIHYCNADREYQHGTYTEKNDSLFLIYNSLKITKSLNWDWENEALMDHQAPEGYTFVQEANRKIGDTLVAFTLNELKYFKAVKEPILFGQPDTSRPFNQYLDELKLDSIPQRMNLRIK